MNTTHLYNISDTLKALAPAHNLTVDVDDSLSVAQWPTYQVSIFDLVAKDNRGRWFELWFDGSGNPDGEIIVTAYVEEDSPLAQESHYNALSALHGLLGMIIEYRRQDNAQTAQGGNTGTVYAQYADLYESVDGDLDDLIDEAWNNRKGN